MSTNLRLSGWQKFWKLDVPFAMPGLVWNMMMSMSGGWFFVVASEAITVGDKTITLPGVGSYLALAIAQKDLHAVGYVILAMIMVILMYDQFLFRPLVAWADKFRMETTASQGAGPQSWVLNLIQRTRIVQRILRPITRTISRIGNKRFSLAGGALKALPAETPAASKVIDWVWGTLIALMAAYALYHIVQYVGTEVTLAEVGHVFVLGLITLLRRYGHTGTDIQRQPFALQLAPVRKLQDARIGIERGDLALDQLDLGRATQRLQLHPAVSGAETAADQPRQHARVPGIRARAEQADTAWRTLHQRPAAQHPQVSMAGPGQDQVVLGHAFIASIALLARHLAGPAFESSIIRFMLTSQRLLFCAL